MLVDLRIKLALTILFFATSSFCFAASKPPALRVAFAKSGGGWHAGSKQKITFSGPATKNAVGIRYHWIDENSNLLLNGAIRRDEDRGWTDEILVPMYSVKGHPHLVVEIGVGKSKVATYRSGKEFNVPPIKGLVIDNKPPVVAGQTINKDKAGHWLEIDVQESSGISQAVLIIGPEKDSQTVPGECKTNAGKLTCLYFMSTNPKGISLTAQLTDLAGNRTIASIQKGSKP